MYCCGFPYRRPLQRVSGDIQAHVVTSLSICMQQTDFFIFSFYKTSLASTKPLQLSTLNLDLGHRPDPGPLPLARTLHAPQ